MDGSRVLRVEIDTDQDGKIDRWEYYGTDQQLARVEISGRRDGKVSRIEHYRQGALVSAEEDTAGTGRFDKWETYEDGHLSMVAFDTTHRGAPDRRLIYGPNGSARVEVDATGTGHFTPVTAR